MKQVAVWHEEIRRAPAKYASIEHWPKEREEVYMLVFNTNWYYSFHPEQPVKYKQPKYRMVKGFIYKPNHPTFDNLSGFSIAIASKVSIAGRESISYEVHQKNSIMWWGTVKGNKSSLDYLPKEIKKQVMKQLGVK